MRRVAELLSLRRSSSNHEPKYAVTSNGRVAPNFLNPPPPHMYQHPQQQPQAVSTVSRGFIKDCLSPNEAGGSSREESPVLGHKTIANCAIHGTLSRPPQPLPPMTSKVSTACQTVHPPPPGNYYNTQTAFCPWGGQNGTSTYIMYDVPYIPLHNPLFFGSSCILYQSLFIIMSASERKLSLTKDTIRILHY